MSIVITIWKSGHSDPKARIVFASCISSISIGRAATNDIILLGRLVSRTHARVEINEEKVTVTDLDSMTGIYLQKHNEITKIIRARITEKCVIAIGDYLLNLSLDNMFQLTNTFADESYVKLPTLKSASDTGKSAVEMMKEASKLSLFKSRIIEIPEVHGSDDMDDNDKREMQRGLMMLGSTLAPSEGIFLPTSVTLRKLINKMFPTDSDFDAFVVDNFPKVKQRIALGMDRTARVTILFEAEERFAIYYVLQNNYREQFIAHRDILHYERNSPQ